MGTSSRIGLVADTHIPEAGADLPIEAYRALAGCDRILHGGDLHDLDVVDRLDRLAPTMVSRGNGDTLLPSAARPGVPDDPRIADVVVVDVGRWRVGLVHDLEHLEDRPDGVVRSTLTQCFGAPVDIVVCGHTHVPMVWGLSDGTALVNPGSPTLPFGYLGILGTVGLIDIDHHGFRITVIDLASSEVQLRLDGPLPQPCRRGPRPAGGH